MTEVVVVPYTQEQFVNSSEPYDYLVAIENPVERDIEINKYKKFVATNYGISAAAFKLKLKESAGKLESRKVSQPAQGAAPLTDFTGQEFALRCPGYYCNDTGIWKDGPYGPVRILMHPIMPVARITDYETREHKTAISFKIGNSWNTQIVPRDVLSSRAAFTKQMSLADAFVTSENCAGVITYLADVESANIDKLPSAHSTGRMGWHEGKFLPFEKDLIFDGDARFRNAYESISKAGSRDAWFVLADKVRADGRCISERCMLAASFASVLLQLVKGVSFFVHLWSDESSTGKTVAMMLGASVWGNPLVGKYTQSLNATNVGIEMLGGFFCNLPLCLDELCTRDKHDGIEDLVYNYCSNTGRVRGSRNGGIQRQQNWCNCVLTTGETPILSEGSRAGAENRVIEIEESRKLFNGKASEAFDVIQENYGFAGEEFVKALQNPAVVDEAKQLRKDYETKLRAALVTEKQSKSMSLLLTADCLASKYVFHDDHNLTVDDVKPFLKKERDVDTNLRAYNMLMDAIVSNNACFEPRDEASTRPLLGKLDERGKAGTYACIIRSKLGTLLMDKDKNIKYNERSFLKWAKRMSLLEVDAEGSPTKMIRMTELGSIPVRCVCIKMNGLTLPAGAVEVDEDLPF